MMVDTMKTLFTLFLSISITLHLHVSVSAEEASLVAPSLRYFTSSSSDGSHRKPHEKLLEISDNKDIDVDALKRGKIPRHTGVPKKGSLKRQNIGRPMESSKEQYNRIGDGVYFVNDNKENSASLENVSKKQVSQVTNTIHAVDKSGSDLAFNAAGLNSKLELFPNEADYGNLKDVSAQQSMQTNNVGFIGNSNFEDVSTGEKSMLKSIENNLSLDDKLTSVGMAKQAEDEHAFEEAKKNTNHMSAFQKLMIEGSKELDLASAADKNFYENSKKSRVATVSTNGHTDLSKRSFLHKPEKMLHYEDIDEIDSGETQERADRRAIQHKTRKSKQNESSNNTNNKNIKYNKHKNKRKSRQKAWQKTDSISKGGSSTNKLGSKTQNEGLVRLLNDTNGSNMKFRLKARQHKLNIKENATSTNNFNVANSKNKNKTKLGRANTSLKRKTKSEVEEVIDNQEYITSPVLPNQLENAAQRSYFTSESDGMGSPEVLEATPPDLPPPSLPSEVTGTGRTQLAETIENHKQAGKNENINYTSQWTTQLLSISIISLS